MEENLEAGEETNLGSEQKGMPNLKNVNLKPEFKPVFKPYSWRGRRNGNRPGEQRKNKFGLMTKNSNGKRPGSRFGSQERNWFMCRTKRYDC